MKYLRHFLSKVFKILFTSYPYSRFGLFYDYTKLNIRSILHHKTAHTHTGMLHISLMGYHVYFLSYAHLINLLEYCRERLRCHRIEDLATGRARDVDERRLDGIIREQDAKDGDLLGEEMRNDRVIQRRIDVAALTVRHENDHAVARGALRQQVCCAMQRLPDIGLAPKFIRQTVAPHRRRIELGIVWLDEPLRKRYRLCVQRQRKPVDEMP